MVLHPAIITTPDAKKVTVIWSPSSDLFLLRSAGLAAGSNRPSLVRNR